MVVGEAVSLTPEENSVWLMTSGLSLSLQGLGGVAKKREGCAWQGEEPAAVGVIGICLSCLC